MPTAMDDYKAWQERNEAIEQANIKRNRDAARIAALASFAGGFIKPSSGNVVAQGAQRGMSAMQEQQEMERQRRIQEFKMEQDMKQLDFQQKVEEFRFNQMKHQAEMQEKMEKVYRDRAEATFKMDVGMMDAMSDARSKGLKFASEVAKYSEAYMPQMINKPVQRATEAVSGKIKQGQEKAQAERKEFEREKLETDIEYAGLGAEQLAQVKEERGIMTPAEREAAAIQAHKDMLDIREQTIKVLGMEADEEARNAFYGVMNGTIDVNSLPRPVASRVLAMLQTHLNSLREKELEEAKTIAQTGASRASAASSYASAERTKTETQKTQLEIKQLQQKPALTFEEIKAMPENVRDQYYYDPIRSLALEDASGRDANGTIRTKLEQMKAEGMSPQDMMKFLQSMAEESGKPRTYMSLATEAASKEGIPGAFVDEKDVEKYIKDSGYSKLASGDYEISVPFFLNIRDSAFLMSIVTDVYSDEPTATMSFGDYTGE